jgi:hypothetical protein
VLREKTKYLSDDKISDLLNYMQEEKDTKAA